MCSTHVIENHKKDEKFLPWVLGDDLTVVSCYAAGEVDDLILGRPSEFDAVKHLSKTLKDSIVSVPEGTSPEAMIDPTTAVAMNRALEYSDSTSSKPLRTVAELVIESERITNLLDQLIDNSEEVRRNNFSDLEKLRSLCLALSSSALAFEEPIEEKEPEIL